MENDRLRDAMLSPATADGQADLPRRLTILAQVTSPVIGAQPLSDQIRTRLEMVQSAFGVDACVVRTLEADHLVLLAAHGVPAAQLHERFPRTTGIFPKLERERQAIAIEDVATDPFTRELAAAARNDPRTFHFVSYAGAPLMVEARVVGLLGLYATQQARRFTQVELDHLQIVANHIAVSVVNDRLYRRVVEQTSQLYRQIRQRESIEAQLRHSQKLDAVGRLAGGVAHDFNNILTAIIGNLELSQEVVRYELGPTHRAVAALEQVEHAALRAAALTRQLLTFSRRDVVRPQMLNVNTILRNLDNMLRRLITENIALETTTDPDLWSVWADTGQVEQVIVNLVVNAVHAMPGGGRLVLETLNVTLDEDYIREHPNARVGPHVLVTVSDTGHGMDTATQARIFEPFFTTKAAEHGTGLGLATVHGIVTQAEGFIMVDSAPGCGTTFHVYLPAAAAVAPAPPELARAERNLSGCETVLLCEDDAAVRDLLALSLRSAGYRVIAAGCAQEGYAAAQAHVGAIALLVTDVIMPDMDGRALSERLRTIHPELATLFVSGYSHDVLAHNGALVDGVEFLEKPVTRQRLLAKVRAVLDKHPVSVATSQPGRAAVPGHRVTENRSTMPEHGHYRA